MARVSYAPRSVEPARLSIGQAIGLRLVDDPLDLRSSVAMVIDQQTGEAIFQKNADAVLPIASITKVMTAMVVLDAGLSGTEVLEVTEADRDTERRSSSRLPIGSRLTRVELLNLALMSSENRAAASLARTYPGGRGRFIAAMNSKAAQWCTWRISSPPRMSKERSSDEEYAADISMPLSGR
jgi:D-alanyl-D-alanine endopeptidase (penicillin-binding protein 7)